MGMVSRACAAHCFAAADAVDVRAVTAHEVAARRAHNMATAAALRILVNSQHPRWQIAEKKTVGRVLGNTP